MKMRITAVVYLLLTCLNLVSCKKWMTTEPRVDVSADVQFASEAGFKKALTDVYGRLTAASLYGRAMSYGEMEFLMNSWDTAAPSVEKSLGMRDFSNTGVQSVFKRVFEGLYGAIAAINEILAHIDERKQVFSTVEMYNTIRSECLALRAFCHFDVLRIFGPEPGKADSRPVLPYVTNLTAASRVHISCDAYMKALLSDLSDAAGLSEKVDPFIHYSQAQLSGGQAASLPGVADDFLTCRFIRMNYYAIKGLQARAYLWAGDNTSALACARVVVDARNDDGRHKFPLGTAASFVLADMNMVTEQMFGLYDVNITDAWGAVFGNGKLKKGTNAAIVTSQLYGNTGTDIRERLLWKQASSNAYTVLKYASAPQQGTGRLGRNLIPLLRVSEMYLVAAETAPPAEANRIWNQFRAARNLAPDVLPVNQADKQRVLAREYHREFFAEGQSFYAYKRISEDHAAIIWNDPAAAIAYQVPLPESEQYP
ncbi:RagB/SusD family nutrient uptake outer membrane protein [Filimonas effusa]|uniref:RagB/SusD family nutrient uptake outer membrane protein n=1 Tax=Filimonas effusa TaxID=2508721 RepID=A0A4Q1D1F6_9BACT|nr:RagB/SusD family nutrient uptake outer membrane protein [Filimonas effusa]RXK80835.1 RagB/SusD family nutrient uptake outer membrane protein [Filimonas effusa]